MSLIPTPATIADAPERGQPLLKAVNKRLGVVPTLFRLISTSPPPLEGYLALPGPLGEGAPAGAEINDRKYSLSALACLHRNLAHPGDVKHAARRMMRRGIRRYISTPR